MNSSNGRLLKIGALLAAAAAFTVSAPLHIRAAGEDLFQEAVNYVLTGSVTPENGPKITDRTSCVVVMPDPKNRRFIRYYLKRFKMDISRITNTYSGRQTFYTLEVEGDDTILEYLGLDQTSVLTAYKTAAIRLPGRIELTERALHVIFTDYCPAERAKTPF